LRREWDIHRALGIGEMKRRSWRNCLIWSGQNHLLSLAQVHTSTYCVIYTAKHNVICQKIGLTFLILQIFVKPLCSLPLSSSIERGPCRANQSAFCITVSRSASAAFFSKPSQPVSRTWTNISRSRPADRAIATLLPQPRSMLSPASRFLSLKPADPSPSQAKCQVSSQKNFA